jgi:hypothetical protein
VRRLFDVVDRPVLHQRQNSVREHLGVDAEVLVVREPGEHGVGDGADAHLEGGTGGGGGRGGGGRYRRAFVRE